MSELRERVAAAIKAVDNDTIKSDGYVAAFTDAVLAALGDGMSSEYVYKDLGDLGLLLAFVRGLVGALNAEFGPMVDDIESQLRWIEETTPDWRAGVAAYRRLALAVDLTQAPRAAQEATE